MVKWYVWYLHEPWWRYLFGWQAASRKITHQNHSTLPGLRTVLKSTSGNLPFTSMICTTKPFLQGHVLFIPVPCPIFPMIFRLSMGFPMGFPRIFPLRPPWPGDFAMARASASALESWDLKARAAWGRAWNSPWERNIVEIFMGII